MGSFSYTTVPHIFVTGSVVVELAYMLVNVKYVFVFIKYIYDIYSQCMCLYVLIFNKYILKISGLLQVIKCIGSFFKLGFCIQKFSNLPLKRKLLQKFVDLNYGFVLV